MSLFNAFMTCAAEPAENRFGLTGIFVNPVERDIAATNGKVILFLDDLTRFDSALLRISEEAKAFWRIHSPDGSATDPYIIRPPKIAAAVDKECVDFVGACEFPNIHAAIPEYGTEKVYPVFSFAVIKTIKKVYKELSFLEEGFHGFRFGGKDVAVIKQLHEYKLLVMPLHVVEEEA